MGVRHLGVAEFVEDFTASVEVEDAVAREGGVSAFPTGLVTEFQGIVLEFIVEDGAAGAFLNPAGPGFQFLKDVVGRIGNLHVSEGQVDGIPVHVNFAGKGMRQLSVTAQPDTGIHLKEMSHFLPDLFRGIQGYKGLFEPLGKQFRRNPPFLSIGMTDGF